LDFSGGSDSKESACNAGDLGLIPGSGRSPGEELATTPVFLPGESHGQREAGSPVGRWFGRQREMTWAVGPRGRKMVSI